ncbi:MAG: hypothetical protein ABEJ03_02470 [Candidatus Nanohaloarchaea archaeon]
MEPEVFEPELRERAKKMVESEVSEVEGISEDKKRLEERAERESESKIPFAWDPREIEHLAENASSMSNEELERFLQKGSELHDKMEDIEDWSKFSRWEERLIMQKTDSTAEQVAEELNRAEEEIEAKRIMMGIHGANE